HPDKYHISFQDVTAQQEKEEMISLASRVIDNANDIIFVWEENGKLFRFNDEALRELKFSEKELNEATIYEMDGNITKEWWEEHFKELIRKKSMTFEWIATRKDNTRFPVEIKASLVPYEGRFLNCAILRNITERKKRDLELYNAFEEIKQLKNQLQIENEYLQEEIKLNYNFDEIIAQSEEYKTVLQKIEKVAPTQSTILITGETGTGKELLARTAHQLSSRKDKPLIKVNCAALPKDLIESELFGHKRGAFTGAIADKIGKFELANNGTIFLDEIGELPIELQPKLLRVLQEGEFDRLGDHKTTTVDIRVIAATNRDLEQMVQEGNFREDLYYRLNVFPVYNIPLRERKSDIPMLAHFFLQKYSKKSGKAFKRLSKATIEKLVQYDFPGNIRELENIIERAVILESGATLFPGSWLPEAKSGNIAVHNFSTLEEMQKKHIVEVLFHTQWRVSGELGAARILGMKDKTLFAKMKKLNIRKEDYLKR
ncbi:MAG: sigma 54-interacting transcriptional regulator, partial [Bacteroidota bacterium]